MALPILIPPVIVVLMGGIFALKKALKGKKLAVLGEQKVGKTCLIDFLTTGSIPKKKYKPTVYARDVPGRRFELRKLKLNISSLTHLSGSEHEYDEWRKVVNEADIVLYLLRVDRLMEGHKPTESRVRRDMKHIGRWLEDEDKDYPPESRVRRNMKQIEKWLKDEDKKYPLFIIGTHCDLTDPDLTTLPTDQLGDYHNKVRRTPIFREIELLGGGGSKVRFVLGSLKSQTTTEELVYHLFGQILRKDKKPI